jgi:hypothetical protein
MVFDKREYQRQYMSDRRNGLLTKKDMASLTIDMLEKENLRLKDELAKLEALRVPAMKYLEKLERDRVRIAEKRKVDKSYGR